LKIELLLLRFVPRLMPDQRLNGCRTALLHDISTSVSGRLSSARRLRCSQINEIARFLKIIT